MTANITVNCEATPLVWDWLQNASIGFAQSLREYVNKNGFLTEPQYNAALRIIEQNSKPKPTPNKIANVDKLMEAFDAAGKNKLKKPKLRFQGFEATLAPAKGKNPGAVYLKSGSQYQGKIVKGEFLKSRECDQVIAEHILETMKDPLAAAVAYGKRTGRCTFCNKELGKGKTAASRESVERGYGPVCAKNFGF